MGLLETLESQTADYDAAVASGDVEAILEFFTGDIVFLVGGRPPVRGTTELRSLVQGWVDLKFAGTHSILTCEEEGSLAYATGTFSVKWQNDKGEFEEFTGKYIDVFRREAGDGWKVQASCVAS